jgi:NADPH:quinone reductase-like Zn-dependent oxidoreductase
MRAAGIEKLGGNVRLMALPEPRARASDEVLVEVRAAGVGNWDEFVRVGGWDVGARPPMALGVEASDVVKAVGARVSRWSPDPNHASQARRSNPRRRNDLTGRR